MEFICLCLPLLPDKRQSTYEKMLNILHSECFEQQTTFKPEHIHFDLEVGMMNAFKISCPSSTIKSCQFHVAQACQNTHLRTNNAFEAFHSHFAKSFKSPHPNVFEFVDKLDEAIRHRIEVRLRSISASTPCEAPKRDRLRQKKRDEIL
ncbi:hypothetical protein RRG08_016300 [Elysia crispata]|uniref:MULE transposase domain-containing protein n=1 Tax=Elysia crispata TaxID=231223 RepID=A0AAE1DNA5_9GAST|nr:hypothetical protein RRG08_016300 [Elysia crispata]